MPGVTLAMWVADAGLQAGVRAALEGGGNTVLAESADLGAPSRLAADLGRQRPDVLLIDLTALREPLETVLQAVRAAAPETLVIALHTTADPQAILAALRAGAGEFLFPPLETTLRQALERRAAQAAPAPKRTGARVLGVLSAKGGCGATTLACHLAAELGRLGAPRRQVTLLMDLDLEAGIVGFLMKAQSPYSIVDAVKNLHRLDVSYWKGLVSNGWQGLEVITGAGAASVPPALDLDHVREVLSFLRGHYEWVVADFGRSLNALTRAALEAVDELYLITTLEVPALHQARQVVQGLLQCGYEKNRVRLMLNRTPQPGTELSAEEVERILEVPIHGLLPNDYAALDECYCEGKLLPPTSNLGRQITRLALKVAGIPEEKGKRRFMLFG